MKIYVQKSWMPLSLLAICMALLSFSSRWGGEGFEIFINNKLVLQQFGKDMNTVKNFQLDQRYSNAELTIKYYHCGSPGKNREITVRDAQNSVLKEWRFGDVSVNDATGMTCSVNDILYLQKRNKDNPLGLYYSSEELPKGKLLMTIVK